MQGLPTLSWHSISVGYSCEGEKRNENKEERHRLQGNGRRPLRRPVCFPGLGCQSLL